MLSEAMAFWDGSALIIVLAGTWLATVARCGWRNMAAAFGALAKLGSPGFDRDANRAALARSIPEIIRRGRLCADAPFPPDRSIAKLVQSYLVDGSIEGLRSTSGAQRSARDTTTGRAVQVFDYAGEQAPIFGLVGTLFALTQVAPASDAGTTEAMMSVVGTAVLSSLYGVITAHLICVPLASAIERRAMREETARRELIVWFEAQLTGRRSNGERSIAAIPLTDAA